MQASIFSDIDLTAKNKAVVLVAGEEREKNDSNFLMQDPFTEAFFDLVLFHLVGGYRVPLIRIQMAYTVYGCIQLQGKKCSGRNAVIRESQNKFNDS